ncbi:uncharacterized protein BO97DRAFT_475293 [Aspergillus homomorphus CBS 101889]|uniref:RRM domain-containing protein n=1 Tax=Aspergillus homomorphus (strain CBS 101889) TaxID=1450537 RepID=A0A395I9Q2_ASPHC|nr:hypothetical protein BO97DRAFT_475293 [Aspergillus homomorphus CBS 101889]RAL16519.1 hypothetical protein BO97DRAFT_475293 [Aspergillus homomorphus CBS 101889]
MAPDKKDKKRKAVNAAAADSPAKKTKKVEAKAAQSPKPILKKAKKTEAPAKVESASELKVNGKPARQVKPRKRAADFLSDNEESEPETEAVEVKANKEKPSTKKSKKSDGTAAPATKGKNTKSESKANVNPKKAEPVVEEDYEDEDDSAASDASQNEAEEDDRTAALISGFESSGDEGESDDEGSKPIHRGPDLNAAQRKIAKKLKENTGRPEEPGTIYVGRIPHGFYENQMRSYFAQFGEVTRVRLSRNRKTGQSKHYAFVEFASTDVAKITAAANDNYLFYGHILKCKYVAPERLHPEIWKGANRRFKKTPWNRIEKRRLDQGKTREKWTERIEKEQQKRAAKAEQLKSILGYDLELPQLKSVDEVPVPENKTIEATEPAAEESAKAIEAPKAKEVEVEKPAEDTPKKVNKKKNTAQSPAVQETAKSATKKTEVAASPASKKVKKAGKKAKGKATA